MAVAERKDLIAMGVLMAFPEVNVKLLVGWVGKKVMNSKTSTNGRLIIDLENRFTLHHRIPLRVIVYCQSMSTPCPIELLNVLDTMTCKPGETASKILLGTPRLSNNIPLRD